MTSTRVRIRMQLKKAKTLITWIGLSVGILLAAGAGSFGTTVPNPSVRYTIVNQTDQQITMLIALESDDPRFSVVDTVGIRVNFQPGLVLIQSHHHTLKAYQRLIIQTNQRQYQTGSLVFTDRCSAYRIQLTPTGLAVEHDFSFLIQRWMIDILIVASFTLVIKGTPLFLVAAAQFKSIYTPFFVVNGLFSLCLLILLNYSFSRPVQAGPIELKYSNFTLLVITLAECLWYYQATSPLPARTRLVIGAVLGSLLWAFPGYLMTVFARFLFAHC